MDRKLIYVDELKEKLSGIQFAGMGYYKANKAVDECAAVDAVEVVHGHWIVGADGSYMCSECGKVFRYEIGYYCSNCGAKMDGDENE